MRIVVRANDARRARAAQSLLANAGVAAAALVGPYRPAPEGEDIAIFPAHGDAYKSAVELAASTMAGESPPLLALAGHVLASPPAPMAAGMDGALALDAPPRMLTGQVDAWRRVGAAEDERRRRRATASSFAVAGASAYAAGGMRVLYIGAPSASFLTLERALNADGGVITAAFSAYTGFDHLHDEAFDAVVLNGAENAPTAISLCAGLRRNAALHHMPTLVITAPGDAATADAAIDRGACAVVASNALCAAPLAWLLQAVRRERRRIAAERELRDLRDLMGEARTGLFRCDAFEAHLQRLAEDHHASGRLIGIAALHVMPAHGARRPPAQNWAKGFAEVSGLAARLIRETDCAVAIGDALIVIATPASDLNGAKHIAGRIASVVECTAFASGDGGAAPLIFEQSVVELGPGESGAGLLARALRGLGLHLATA